MSGKHSKSFFIESSASEQQGTYFDDILTMESALLQIKSGIF
jgi:hypothetical protein